MEKIEINIVDEILRTRVLLSISGEKVKLILAEKISMVTQPTLFVLNLEKANPLDYKFIIIAFKEIIMESLSNEHVFIIFKVEETEFDELCYGITDILELKIEVSERNTLESFGFSMIYVNDADTCQYLSKLSIRHIEVLNEIEQHDNISSTEIQDKFSLVPEAITEILNALLKSKFIIKSADTRAQYISVRSFI